MLTSKGPAAAVFPKASMAGINDNAGNIFISNPYRDTIRRSSLLTVIFRILFTRAAFNVLTCMT